MADWLDGDYNGGNAEGGELGLDYDGEYAEGEELDAHYADWEEDGSGPLEEEEALTLQDTVHLCVIPTARDAVLHIGKLLFWCLVIRLLLTLVGGRYPRVCHLVSATIGCVVLGHFFDQLLVSFVAHALLCCCVLTLSGRWLPTHSGQLAVAASLAFILVCELHLVDPVRWHSVRGAHMVLMMKAVSAGFDRAESTPATATAGPPTAAPSPLQLLGYLLHPGSCVFGPWLPLSDYVNSTEKVSPQLVSVTWLRRSAFSMCASLIWMGISTCWLPYVFPDRLVLTSVWIIAYREALAFRSSHYFVSYLSQASLTLSGINKAVWAPSGEVQVSRPWHIEAPRSLVEVVVNWNAPMHFWLKTYVFRVSRPAGASVAVFCTYVASAVLHGLNFQLAAVLLSLGGFTFAEHWLRTQLADAFGACVLARRCRRPCAVHAATAATRRILNALLSLLCLLQLAYLGVVFDSSPASQTGYNWRHTVQRWHALGYTGHWLALGTLLVSKWLL